MSDEITKKVLDNIAKGYWSEETLNEDDSALQEVALQAVKDSFGQPSSPNPEIVKVIRCPLCKMNKWEVLRTAPKFTIARCLHCETPGIFDPIDQLRADMKARGYTFADKVKVD